MVETKSWGGRNRSAKKKPRHFSAFQTFTFSSFFLFSFNWERSHFTASQKLPKKYDPKHDVCFRGKKKLNVLLYLDEIGSLKNIIFFFEKKIFFFGNGGGGIGGVWLLVYFHLSRPTAIRRGQKMNEPNWRQKTPHHFRWAPRFFFKNIFTFFFNFLRIFK